MIVAEHSSGLHSVEPKALRAALAEQVANEPDFLSLTEMMNNDRSAVLDDFAPYAAAQVGGTDGRDECALMVKRTRYKIVSTRAVKLSDLPIPRRGGKLDFALVVLVEDVETGERHTRIVVHRPSGVDGETGLEDNEQARVYRDGTQGLTRLLTTIGDRVVITGDWNLDLRKKWVRGYLALHFPNFVPTWRSRDMPEQGTLGDRVIDFSLVRGFSVTAAQVISAFGASDHRAIRETHKEIPMTWRVAKSLDVVLAEVNAMAPNRSKLSDGSIGDASHASRDSDHNPWVIDSSGVGVVRARDFTHDPVDGFDCTKFAARVGALLGKHPALGHGAYVIWNRRIISTDRLSEGWRTYSGTNPHDKHCHVSVGLAGYDSTLPWLTAATKPQEDIVTPEDIEKIVAAVADEVTARVGDAIRAELLMGQDDAPEGRRIGATLSGTYNAVRRIEKKLEE